MHPTMVRLYEAAWLLHRVKKPGKLARLLNVSPQLVHNWESRGMSSKGMLEAQRSVGCSATWLETGEPPMLANPVGKHGTSEPSISEPNNPAIRSTTTTATDNLAKRVRQTQPKRLRQALAHQGILPPELASVAGVSIETCSLWLGGIGPEISLAQAVAIQNAYGVNSVWLVKGKGEPGVAVRDAEGFRPITDLHWGGVPVVGFAQLRDNRHFADINYPVGYGDGHVASPTADKDAYALRCVGDSMRPRIKDREFVVAEPNHPIEPGDEVLVKSKDGGVMVKEFLYKRAGRLHLVSVNEAHSPITIAEEEIEKMHYVGWIVKPSAWRPG